MNQNDIIAGLLAAGVVGGLAILRHKTMAAAGPPVPPPGVIIAPGSPGADPQLASAQQTIASAFGALAAQGGGTQTQRDQMATALEAQATQIDLLGGSPSASAALRQAAAQLRGGGQLPAPGPAPLPVPPSPGVDPQLASAQQLIAQITAGLQSQGANLSQPQLDAAATTLELQAAAVGPTSPGASQLLQQSAAQLRAGQLPGGLPVSTPRPPPNTAINVSTPGEIRSADGVLHGLGGGPTQIGVGIPATGALLTRYHELRDHLAQHLQGVKAIDHAVLGAADRTATDLRAIGDKIRASELGALASASYQRAGLSRPQAVLA